MKDKKSKEKLLAKMLSIIKKKPGIRPSELNRILNIPHTANLRNILIRKGSVIKKRDNNAVHYYPKN